MKVRYLGSTYSACDMYRASIPFSTLLEKGHDVEFIGMDVQRALASGKGYELEADVLIVPRPLSKFAYDVAFAAKSAGIAVVVELDDDMDTVHPNNTAYHDIQRGLQWLNMTLAISDLVTVSTQRLADKYGEKTVVVPNCVTDKVFEIEPTEEKWGVGWTGSIDVHPNDLQVVGNAIRKLAKQDVEFRHVGHGNLTEIIKSNYISYGFLEFGEYFHLINTFAVGIVPLEQSPFNNAKSYLKGIEYAAMGVPFVASPVAEYEYLNKVHGLGVIAKSEYQWFTEIRRMLRSDKALKELSEEYRQVAFDNFRMSQNDWRWLEAWEEAARRRQQVSV